jgi:hypothetical protein
VERLAKSGDRSSLGVKLRILVVRREKRGVMGLGRFEAVHLGKVPGLMLRLA